jgi:branched-chain amino acid transport system substrate-binding protein
MSLNLSKRTFIAAAAVLLFGSLNSAQAQQATGEPIKIGAVLSVTGPAAGLGVLERDVLVMGEKLLNAKGGVRSRPIQVIIRDDTTNPDTALSQANDLIFGQKVVALLGPTISATTVAVGGVTHRNNIPQFSFAGIGPAVEFERKCVFHMPIGLELRGHALLTYAREIGAKRVGVLHDAGFGNIIQGHMRKVADKYGVELVAIEKFEFGATDTTTQAAKVKAVQPDAVVIITASATPFRDVRRLQMNQPIIADLASSTYEYVNAMGPAADNIVFPEFVIGEDPLPHQKDFVALYQKEFNRLPKFIEAFTWDALVLLTDALAKVGPDAGGEKICAAVREKPYAGVFATYDFSAPDLNGVTMSSFVFAKLVHGKYTRLPFRVKE